MSSSSNNSPITIPKGFRFHPSDEELLTHYLEKKNQGKDSEIINIIPEISVCKHEPRDLPALVFAGAGYLDKEWFTVGDTKNMEWYLFSPCHRKYNKGTRSNRTTAEGYWKSTTKTRKIKARGSNTVIGRKKILTFYQRAEPKPKRTDWVIHEYQAPSNDQIGDFVLCRLKKKPGKKDAPIHDETESGSSGGSSTVENQAAETGMITEAQENQVNILNKDECNGSLTDSCLAENPSNLDSIFNLPQQLHQPSQSTYQPQEYPQLGTNLSSLTIQQQDFDYTLSSINREPRDIFHYNDFIDWNDLQSLFGDFESSLAKFSDPIIDGNSVVRSDENTEVSHGSGYSALAIGAFAPM